MRIFVRLCLIPLLVTGLAAGCSKKKKGVDRSDGRIPTLRAPQVKPASLKIDGKLDEAAWSRAGRTGPFVHPGSGVQPRSGKLKTTTARILWDAKALYVGLTVHDKKPTSPFRRSAVDPHIWARASGVELMVQPGDPGNNRHYYEVQVDVNGAVWDTRFTDYNRPRRRGPRGMHYGVQAWSARLERAVSRGSGKYTVELALPWAALTPARGQRTAIPPKPGDVWRINLYSFRDGQRAALAWSPILGLGNFHRSSRFGKVRFVQ